MTRKYITLFMWGYQEHFCLNVRLLTQRVLEEIGAAADARVLLVGVRRPDIETGHPVCVEPETGEWPLELFNGLDLEIEADYPNHPDHQLFFGDQRTTEEQPEMIRRQVIRDSIAKRLQPYDAEHGTFSYVAAATPVAGYHVVTVLQIPRATLDAHPEVVGRTWKGDPASFSFMRASLASVAREAVLDLQRPEPGRQLGNEMRAAAELVRQAATDFTSNLALTVNPRSTSWELWPVFNRIAGLRYEGAEGSGRIVFVPEGVTDATWTMKFERPPALRDSRWARKLLQMSSSDTPLLANTEKLLGLGRLGPGAGALLAVDFHGHHDWELRHGESLLMRVEAGAPRLPLAAVPPERFRDTAERLFKDLPPERVDRLVDILSHQSNRRDGSLLVIAQDAAAEAERLALQSTRLEPTVASDDLLECASSIDGAILMDPLGICHAIGVVLDGPARDECTPARGARYNTALRYVAAGKVSRVAIVVSDDRTVDVLPLLRPKASAVAIQAALQGLEASTHENYHPHRRFLDEHRFYMNPEQCRRANEALERIDAEPSEGTEIRLQTPRFAPNPNFDASYLR